LGRVALEDFFDEFVVLLGELEGEGGIVLRGVAVLEEVLLELGELGGLKGTNDL
jgi:hypothetical protein